MVQGIMLENYQKALSPQSLLDVVPRSVLQSLMQGFFYGHRAGMALLYNKGADSKGIPHLERLGPVDHDSEADWRDQFVNFNPFCAKFRDSHERNEMCENCDLTHAQRVYAGTLKGKSYLCHMGLIDMVAPIKIGEQIYGVLFGGQRIVSDDPRMVENIKALATKRAPHIAEDLHRLIDVAGDTQTAVNAFEISFRKFADSLQTTVEAFAKAKYEQAERETLLEVSAELARSLVDEPDGWTTTAKTLLNELEVLFGSKPVWLLQRRGSRYQCVAVSTSACDLPQTNVAVAALIHLPTEKVIHVPQNDLVSREVKSKFGIKSVELILVRSDIPVSDIDVASLVLVVGGNVSSKLDRFVIGCIRALAYPAGVSGLFQRLEKQQKDFARHASFTGHHLKTPLQIALFALYETRHCNTLQDFQQHIPRASDQIELGLADALRLQDAAIPLMRERFNVVELVEKLIGDFHPSARQKGIRFEMMIKTEGEYRTNAILSQIRVALSNLLDNAIKYSFESKWIEVRFSKIALSSAVKTPIRGMLALEIEDVGQGFANEHKDELFNLGTRLDKTKGTWARTGRGIGLAQAKEYIEAAGGSLDINSESLSHSGRKFRVIATIHLPLV